jgi:anti-anti-sigma regulatory factor
VLNITIEFEQARVPVTVLRLEGELDAATFQDVINRAGELIEQGTGHILLDMGGLTYMGSSGLFAIRSVAVMLRGERPPDPESGWGAVHELAPRDSDTVAELKLLNPPTQVDRVLERTGLKRYFETFDDSRAALESF